MSIFSWFKTTMLSLFIKFKQLTSKNTRAMNEFGNFTNVEYVRNYDGDTITVNIKKLHPLIGRGINIRVSGIDTPEMRGGCEESMALAKEAKLVVQKLLVDAKHINLLNCQRGKYFRIVAEVYADNVNIGKLLIVKGLAVEYDGGKKIHDWCK